MAHNSSEHKVRSSCFRLAIKCKLPWRERDAGNVGFTSGLPTLQQEVGERNRVLIRTFRCVGVSRNKQHSTTEQPGSGFISISCHFSAAVYKWYLQSQPTTLCHSAKGLAMWRARKCPLRPVLHGMLKARAEITEPAIASIQSYFGQACQSYAR